MKTSKRLKTILCLAALTLLSAFVPSSKSFAQECFIGEVRMFAGNFAPRAWAFADGQTLLISQNSALFSILGTTYGGDGETTFKLPDLRGRVPVHVGDSTGPGLSPKQLGQKGGAERHTLTISQMPSHSHTLRATDEKATAREADGNSLATTWPGSSYSQATPNTDLKSGSNGNTGGNQPHNIMQPFLGINYIICLQGIFPSR